MAEKKFDKQIDQGWGYTFVPNGQYPAIGNRIFSTKADAEAFLLHPTAIPGLILRVIEDSVADNNGAYLTELVNPQQGTIQPLKMTKLGSGGGSGSIEAILHTNSELLEVPALTITEQQD